MYISIHDVKSVEICNRYVSNNNQRVMRITYFENGRETEVEITLYKRSEALERLEKSADFYDADERKESLDDEMPF